VEKRLGRGLGTLLGGSASEASGAERLPVDAIRPNPHQPRRVFDRAALEELTQSILRHGVLQPIVVRPLGTGYELIAGERRLRASIAAGQTSIPALVRKDVTDQQLLELALVENVQRQDLDPIEKARGYRQLCEQLSLSQDRVAEMVGLRRATVANHIRLLELPEVAQQAVQDGSLTMGHARALLGLADPDRIVNMVGRIIREGLSVREVEAMVRASTRPAPNPRPDQVLGVAPWIRDLEQRMSEHLGTRVSIQNVPGYRGQIVIDYYQRSDLDRLIEKLAPRSTV